MKTSNKIYSIKSTNPFYNRFFYNNKVKFLFLLACIIYISSK